MKNKYIVLLVTCVCIFILSLVSMYYYAKSKQEAIVYDNSNFNYDIYVINLARRRDRMVKFGANYDFGMPYKILDAVDGKNLNLDDLVNEGKVGVVGAESIRRVESGQSRKHHYELGSVGAVGCTLSHWNAWNKAQTSTNNLIVFEDDAVVNGIKVDELDKRINSLPDDWHVYIIGRPHTMYTALRVNENLVKVQRFCGTHAYVVSPKGIDFLLKQGRVLPINQQLDSHMSELCMDHGFNVYAHTNAHMFVIGDNTTDIQVSNQGNPIDDKRLKLE